MGIFGIIARTTLQKNGTTMSPGVTVLTANGTTHVLEYVGRVDTTENVTTIVAIHGGRRVRNICVEIEKAL